MDDGRILEMDGSGGSTTLSVHLMPLPSILKIYRLAIFMLRIFYRS